MPDKAEADHVEPRQVHAWAPPFGGVAKLVPAGTHWDAVSVPGELAGVVRQRLGAGYGAVIGDPYEHYETWLTVPGATWAWVVPESADVRLLSTAACLWVPPLSVTQGPGTHWARPWTPDRGLTDPEPLLAALLGAVGEAGVSRLVVG